MSVQAKLRQLPSVDKLLNTPDGIKFITEYGHESTLQSTRDELEAIRASIIAGEEPDITADTLLLRIRNRLYLNFQPTLRPVFNATGVIIHTNLGRAPLSQTALSAVDVVTSQYNTLEFNLENGKRGSRLDHASKLLKDITGAEAAVVVNNNAAALVLLLSALAKGREVIISRGQLVEIGGGFRIPEIMEQSGARLIEVGATNRTRLSDFERAISENTAMIMRVHSSNFKQIGFVEQPELADLSELAHKHNLIMVDDLGSGTFIDTEPMGLEHEPTVQESLQAGVDLVTFSGDKLLGGPQAGILIGTQSLIQQLKTHPLARALRVDKLTYAALVATLEHYRKGDALAKIPIWQMMSQSLDNIQIRANHWAELTGGTVVNGESTIGGGSLPGATLPTALLALNVDSADSFMEKLRGLEIPIIARIVENQVLFDPRTILPQQEARFLELLLSLLK